MMAEPMTRAEAIRILLDDVGAAAHEFGGDAERGVRALLALGVTEDEMEQS